MSARRRVPGTYTRPVAYLLPSIDDDTPDEIKNKTAIRNICATEGVCPCCGAEARIKPDADLPLVWHATFAHEDWCVAVAA